MHTTQHNTTQDNTTRTTRTTHSHAHTTPHIPHTHTTLNNLDDLHCRQPFTKVKKDGRP